MIAMFNRFEIEMTKKQAVSGSHQGECYDDVVILLECPKIRRQLNKITDEDMQDELREYGAWNEDELSNRYDNNIRILWLAAEMIRNGE